MCVMVCTNKQLIIFQIAVSTLDGNISFFNATTCDQTASLEGRNDLGAGRADTDLVTPEKLLKTKLVWTKNT